MRLQGLRCIQQKTQMDFQKALGCSITDVEGTGEGGQKEETDF